MASFSLNTQGNNRRNPDNWLLIVSLILLTLFFFVGKSCTAMAQDIIPNCPYCVLPADSSQNNDTLTIYTFNSELDSLIIEDVNVESPEASEFKVKVDSEKHTITYTQSYPASSETESYVYFYDVCESGRLFLTLWLYIETKNGVPECQHKTESFYLEPIYYPEMFFVRK